MPTDYDLITAILQGDTGAWEVFYQRHAGDVEATALAIARGLGLNKQDAEDACQDLAAEMPKKAQSYRGDMAVCATPWLRMIVRRKLITMARKRKHFKSVPEEVPDESEDLNCQQIIRTEEMVALMRAFAHLEDQEQLILRMRILEGKTLENVAAVIGCCVSQASNLDRICPANGGLGAGGRLAWL